MVRVVVRPDDVEGVPLGGTSPTAGVRITAEYDRTVELTDGTIRYAGVRTPLHKSTLLGYWQIDVIASDAADIVRGAGCCVTFRVEVTPRHGGGQGRGHGQAVTTHTKTIQVVTSDGTVTNLATKASVVPVPEGAVLLDPTTVTKASQAYDLAQDSAASAATAQAAASSSAAAAAASAALVGAPADAAIAAAIGGPTSQTVAALKPREQHRNVRDYGAKGDGVTDDTAAIQAALNAGRGTVYLPPKPDGTASSYLVSGLIARDGVRLTGQLHQAKIVCATGPAITTPAGGTSYVHGFGMHRVTIEGVAGPGAGHLVTGMYALGSWTECTIEQREPSKSAVSVTGWIDMDFQVEVDHVLSATVPAFYATTSTGELAQSSWRRSRFTHSGNYAIRIEGKNGSVPIALDFTNINFERCEGGAIDLLSCRHVKVSTPGLWDFVTAASKHLIHIGKSATAGAISSDITIDDALRDASTAPAAGVMDIKVDAGSATGVRVVNARHQLGYAFNVDLGGCPGEIVGGAVTVVGDTKAGNRNAPFPGRLPNGRLLLSGHPAHVSFETSTPPLPKDTWKFAPVTLDRSVKCQYAGVIVATPATGGTATARIALYSVGSHSLPGSLVMDLCTLDLTVAGENLGAFTGTIPPGDYYIGVGWSGTATGSPALAALAGVHPSISPVPATLTSATGYTQSVSAATTPATASVSGADRGIGVWVVMTS